MPNLIRPAAAPTNNNNQRPQIVRTDGTNVRLASAPLVRTLISQGAGQGNYNHCNGMLFQLCNCLKPIFKLNIDFPMQVMFYYNLPCYKYVRFI